MTGEDGHGKTDAPSGRPNILIIQTVASNGGDAAILLSICDGLREHFPDARIRIADSRPRVVSELYPELEFVSTLFRAARGRRGGKVRQRLRALWRKAVLRVLARLPRRRLRGWAMSLLGRSSWRFLEPYLDADLVIATGGTYLVEAYSLGDRFFDFDIVRGLGRPLVLFTQTFGPFRSTLNRHRMRRLLADAKAAFVRDEASLRAASDIGADTGRIRVAPDVVFMRSTPDSRRRLRRRLLENPRDVCLSVRDWSSLARSDGTVAMDRYLDALAGFTGRVVAPRDVELHFLSTCQGVEGYHYDDSDVAARVVRRMPADARDSVEVLDGFHTPAEIRDRLTRYDLLIATRMHMAILGLTAGVPVIPIAYEPKIESLFRQLGYPFEVIDANEISEERLIDQWERLPGAWREWRTELAVHLEAFARRARLPFGAVREILSERGFSPGTVGGETESRGA